MRTTLTLDDDIAVMVERIGRQRQLSLKEVVNQALRVGLEQLERPRSGRAERFETAVVSLGGCLLPDLEDIAGVLEVLEGDQHR
jgi:hypothetical protein